MPHNPTHKHPSRHRVSLLPTPVWWQTSAQTLSLLLMSKAKYVKRPFLLCTLGTFFRLACPAHFQRSVLVVSSNLSRWKVTWVRTGYSSTLDPFFQHWWRHSRRWDIIPSWILGLSLTCTGLMCCCDKKLGTASNISHKNTHSLQKASQTIGT